MADQPPEAHSESSQDIRDDTGVRRDRELTTGAPRWVKVLGIIALIVVVLLVVIGLLTGGNHGPGRHTAGVDYAPPSRVTAQGA